MLYSGRIQAGSEQGDEMTRREYELKVWQEYYRDAVSRGIANPSDHAERKLIEHMEWAGAMRPAPWN